MRTPHEKKIKTVREKDNITEYNSYLPGATEYWGKTQEKVQLRVQEKRTCRASVEKKDANSSALLLYALRAGCVRIVSEGRAQCDR